MTYQSSDNLIIPAPERPSMIAGYGISAETDGLLEWSWLAERFADARNYWVASSRSNGGPHVMPVWGVWVADRLVFATDADSVKGRNLTSDPRVVVHTGSGDEMALIEGRAEPIPLGALAAADSAYLAKYGMTMTAAGDPLILRIQPVKALAWREKDFPISATRWRFPT